MERKGSMESGALESQMFGKLYMCISWKTDHMSTSSRGNVWNKPQ